MSEERHGEFSLTPWQVKEQEIRRQFRDAVRTQNKQYKLLKETISLKTPKAEQKAVLAKLKDDQMRRMAMLGDQYEHSIAEVMQHQNVSNDCYIVLAHWFTEADTSGIDVTSEIPYHWCHFWDTVPWCHF